MSLLYSYLLSTKKINLPTSSDKMLSDNSLEIEEILNYMIGILRKEKSFIKGVQNSAIETLLENEAIEKTDAEEKENIISNQKKKMIEARAIAKKN